MSTATPPLLLRLAALVPAVIALAGCTLARSDATPTQAQQTATSTLSGQEPPSPPVQDATDAAEAAPSAYQNPERTRERIERYKEQIGHRPAKPADRTRIER